MNRKLRESVFSPLWTKTAKFLKWFGLTNRSLKKSHRKKPKRREGRETTHRGHLTQDVDKEVSIIYE